MRENGFTLIEVMIALLLFSLVIGLGYGLLVSIEQLNLENRIYFHVVQIMQTENQLWRNNQDIVNKTILFEQAMIYQNVERYFLSPHLERAEVTYWWNIGKKEYHVHWHLDRLLP